jgi:hypothetical protein
VTAADGSPPELVAYADQKHHIRAKALELGVPVADGEVVILPRAGGRRRRDYDALRAAVERHLPATGQAIVRGAQGAAGASTFVVGGRGEDVDGLLRRLGQREDNRIYLVEVLVPAIVSPHVQLHVAPAGGPITCLGVTDQRWERPFVHGGNIFPSTGRSAPAMLDWSCRLATWFQSAGYAGHLGLDFVEYADPATGAVRTLLAEVHPRVDGATEPLGILARHNADQRAAGRPESLAFVSGTLELGSGGLARLAGLGRDFLYTAERGRGVVPCEPNGAGPGRVRLVMLGASRDEVLRGYGELQTWSRRGPR